MKRSPIQIQDCIKPKPEYFLDQHKGGVIIHSGPMLIFKIGHLLLGETKRSVAPVMAVYWMKNDFPAALLAATIFYEN